MAIVSFVDQANNAGNFDEIINNNIVTSFLLNVGHEGVEITSDNTPIITTLNDYNILINAVNVWRVLVNVAFNMPLTNPTEFSQTYNQSPDLTETNFSVSGNSFSMNETNSTGIIELTPISSCFLTWGEFNMYMALNRQFNAFCFNINQIPV